MNNKEKGRIGEDVIADYLEKTGCFILSRNYTCPYGEIDVIFMEDNVLVFGEVKARSTYYFGRPCQAVDFNKKRHIVESAKCFLSGEGNIKRDIRFDVFEVNLSKQTYRHIRNAYTIENL